jgi:predicted nucleotidyltransferase
LNIDHKPSRSFAELMSNLMFDDTVIKKIKSDVIKHFYCEERHHGVMVFGSSIKGSKYASDVDLVLLSNDLTVYNHRIEIIEETVFDIFEMPPEYAFCQLQARAQMWLYSFSTACLIVGNNDLLAIIDSAKEILNNQQYECDPLDLEKHLFSLNALCNKLARKDLSIYQFTMLGQDFFNRAHQVLHALYGRWPDTGSRLDKIERTFSDFDGFSEILRKIVLSTDVREKVELYQSFMTKVNLKGNYRVPRAIHIETKNIARAVSQIINQLDKK